MINNPANNSNLLISEPPLQVIPSLAVKIGLNEAIFLQQVHYWLKYSKNFKQDRAWVYNTYAEWQAQFPFWCDRTIRRVVQSLEKMGLIVSSATFNREKGDRTKWYSIDYQKLNSFDIGTSGQIDQMVRASCPGHADKLATCSIQENTQENTQYIGGSPSDPDIYLGTYGVALSTHGTMATNDEVQYQVARPLPATNPNRIEISPRGKSPRAEFSNKINYKKTTLKATVNPANDEAFKEFWTAYPRKINKQAARKAYDGALMKEGGLNGQQTIVEAARKLTASVEAKIEKGKGKGDVIEFIPHPATWLNGERWEDEVLIDEAKEQKKPISFLSFREMELEKSKARAQRDIEQAMSALHKESAKSTEQQITYSGGVQ